MKLIAKTLSGLEEVLANEVKVLTGKDCKILTRAVEFEGDLEDIYKLNYLGRSVLRVLAEIKSGKIQSSEQSLYDFVYAIDWLEYLGPENTLSVDSVVYSEFFTHANYVALKAKDAIVDKIRDLKGSRPDIDRDDPDLTVHIYLNTHNEVAISLDSSGESLHKRGYRREHYLAPINEVLASGIIQMSEWNKTDTFFDPMCGSGTFPAEALMLAADIPARYLKPNFSFQKWKTYDEGLWHKIKSDADEKVSLPKCEIYAHDLAFNATEITKRNLRNLAFGQLVEVKQRNFLNTGGLKSIKKIFINPPYDHRMANWKVDELYRGIGDKLKNDYVGSESWVITANKEAMKSFGLRPSKKYSLYNGELDCTLFKFDVYEGSKKIKYQKRTY